jgi:hypothetical protein
MKHIGYIIANDREEFLHSYKCTNGIESRGWSLTPEMAKIYNTRAKAQNIANKMDYRPVWVLELLDMENQLVVASDDEVNRPTWLR